jgi:hypothetical protein
MNLDTLFPRFPLLSINILSISLSTLFALFIKHITQVQTKNDENEEDVDLAVVVQCHWCEGKAVVVRTAGAGVVDPVGEED